MRIDEIYDRQLSAFKQHMVAPGAEFEPSEWWGEICDMIVDNGWGDYLNLTPKDLRDSTPDMFYELPSDMQRKIEAKIMRFAKMNSPERLPTHSAARFNRIVKPSEWLVHFTDHADDIATDGFVYGIDRMDRLGYTKFCSQRDKCNGGWNFAFTADNPTIGQVARRGKYGKHAVMFRAGGVEITHHGDREKQVVFYGKNFDPSDIVVLHDSWDGYRVMSRNQKWTAKTGREWVHNGEFESCVEFVSRNFQQYHKIITGHNK